ncbi:MAG: carboxypeptidase regulatory-like domain-containing protein [Deltaproteobacteria bacterium]|nr:carboxypeptidase regulatory-like domain-containing protein [Deltaproteobacteria bacterium]
MRRLLLALALATAAAAPAHAQIAAAIGKPLPSPDLPAGTVSVRVVAGSPSSPVEGTDVTLLVNGTPRVARTDSAGRAIFKDLPAGATVQAKAVDADKKETQSEAFPLPGDNGVRLMLTTKPWNPGAGMPAAGGAGGMPDPINMSGQARTEQNDAAGSFTVRLTYDDFKDVPPAGTPVALVGYTADDRVLVQWAASDKEGRAAFKDLDRSGATAYFALAQLPRGNAIDRLESIPTILDNRAGMRLILSSAKRSSSDAPIDELSRLDKQDPPVADGKVRVSLEGLPSEDEIRLFQIDAQGKKTEVGHQKPAVGAPDPGDIMANATFGAKADLPPGNVDVLVHGGVNSDNEGMGGVVVKIVKASAAQKGDLSGAIESKTTDDGKVRIALQIAEPVVAVVTVNGKDLTSKPFDLSKQGGALDVEAHWSGTGKLEAKFDVAPSAGAIYYAETTLDVRGDKTVYRSVPFEQVSGHGTHVSLFIYPRVLFQFSLTSQLDDQYLVVGGRFEVSNNSWAPYVGGKDGVLIPMPKGFGSTQINEDDQQDVGVAEGQGFRIVTPIPPGGKQFHAQFALSVKDGKINWDMDLPFGVYQSELELMHVPGMSVQTPPGVKGQLMKAQNGTEFFVLPEISILPKQRMVMSIVGLPHDPGWKYWVPRLVGGVVVLVMAGGLAFALLQRRPDVERQQRRQALLDELVELERTNKDKKRREAILNELENLWGDSTS